MSDVILTGSIALTKLKHAMIKGKTGQNCIVIPVDDNYLEKDEKGNYYIPIRVTYKPDGDKFGQNGFIGKSIPSAIYKAASDAEKEKFKEATPILGNIKCWESGGSTAPNSVPTLEVADGDDVPF